MVPPQRLPLVLEALYGVMCDTYLGCTSAPPAIRVIGLGSNIRPAETLPCHVEYNLPGMSGGHAELYKHLILALSLSLQNKRVIKLLKNVQFLTDG